MYIIVIATIIVWFLMIGMFMVAMNSLQSEYFHSIFTCVRITVIILTLTLIGNIT